MNNHTFYRLRFSKYFGNLKNDINLVHSGFNYSKRATPRCNIRITIALYAYYSTIPITLSTGENSHT